MKRRKQTTFLFALALLTAAPLAAQSGRSDADFARAIDAHALMSPIALRPDAGAFAATRDCAVFRLDIAQSAAAIHGVSFKDVLGKLRTGEKYYVVWNFTRLGKVSTSAEQKGGRSQNLMLTGLHD